jgi:hypothetical protein
MLQCRKDSVAQPKGSSGSTSASAGREHGRVDAVVGVVVAHAFDARAVLQVNRRLVLRAVDAIDQAAEIGLAAGFVDQDAVEVIGLAHAQQALGVGLVREEIVDRVDVGVEHHVPDGELAHRGHARRLAHGHRRAHQFLRSRRHAGARVHDAPLYVTCRRRSHSRFARHSRPAAASFTWPHPMTLAQRANDRRAAPNDQ